MSFFSKIFPRIFYELDLFKTPLFIFIDKNQKASTTLGSLMSVLIIVFLISSFLNSNMYLRINPFVIDSIAPQTHRSLINLDNTNFSLAMSLNNEDGTNFINPTMFTFNLRLRTLETVEGKIGYQETNYDQKIMKPCTKEYFQGNPSMFVDLALQDAMCLENSTLHLEGYWDEKKLIYIKIWLNKCQNRTDSEIICKSDDIIQNFLMGNYFGVYYQDFSFDLKNYSNPLKKNYKYDYQQGSIFYQKYYLTLDFENVAEDGMLNTILIYASNNKQATMRKYQKFTELLANIGGTAKALMMIGLLFFKYQAKLNVMRIVMNKLYYFPIAQQTYSSSFL